MTDDEGRETGDGGRALSALASIWYHGVGLRLGGAPGNREREVGGCIEVLRRGSSGFTLVELLVVVAILGILVSIVSVSVIGMMGRGGRTAYDTDERTIQTFVSTFYADVHCFDSRATGGGWNEPGNCTAGHYFPTRHGNSSNLHAQEMFLPGKTVRAMRDAEGHAATPEQMRDGAVWMGLLVNEPGSGAAGPDAPPGNDNSPMSDEGGRYLQDVPESCSKLNHPAGTGTYTWIVGNLGRVYGCYEEGGVWYAGFSGQYP